jgi:hypothetical protein
MRGEVDVRKNSLRIFRKDSAWKNVRLDGRMI